jgi:uncharacterized membrane-anchored protein YhcB (DUF1043 family)
MVNEGRRIPPVSTDHPWAAPPATVGGLVISQLMQTLGNPTYRAQEDTQRMLENSLLIDRLA